MTTIKNRNEQRVVVTGLGVISSIGIGWEEFWKNLIAGKSGISKITSFDTSEYDRHYAGEIKNFDPLKFIFKRKASRIGRSSQMAIAATKLTLEDSGLNVRELTNKRVGVCLGTTMGEPQIMEKLDERCIPNDIYEIGQIDAFSYPASNIASNVANEFKFNNHNLLFSNACSAGNYAIGVSYDLIRTQKSDYMIVGGSDAFSRIAFTGFSRLFAVAPEICQPFDKNRKGMIPGEGAGVLLLESLESALNRDANIYAEILGYGLSCDARHMTNPSEKGIENAMKNAVNFSRINPQEIDYISAHGTGTIENDKTECRALKNFFNSTLGRIPVSSIKSMLGHTMGAASALEAIACCLVVKKGIIPPTINIESQDPLCNINCVPNKSLKETVNVAMNNSAAFGGNNASVILKKFL